MAPCGVSSFSRSLRLVARCVLTASSSRLVRSILLRASLLSTSICCSPIPLAADPPPPVPPPPSRSRCPHILAILGSAYCILASSTWSVASLVCARWAKMSRMTSSRSMTQMPASSSHSLC